MKVGLSSLYLSVKPFKELVNTLKTYGSSCQNWEIVDENRLKLEKLKVKALRDLQNSLGLDYTVHAPFFDINIASVNPSVRKLSMKMLERSLSNAALLEAKMFVFHPGFHSAYSAFDLNLPKSLNVESVSGISKQSENLGIPVSVENMPNGLYAILSRVEDFEEFFKSIGPNSVGLALDTGHANTVGQLELFLKKFGDVVTHVHLHDNDGSFDTHDALGDGNINWVSAVKTLRSRGYGKFIIIESTKRPQESLEKLKAVLQGKP